MKKASTEFGEFLAEKIRSEGYRQTELARTVKASTAMVNHVVSGRKVPPPKWVDLIADVTGCSDEERLELHRRASRDLLRKKGYQFDLDLTKED